MSGEGSPERGGGGSRGRQARRSTPWSNASRWPARRCEQRLSRSGIGGASLRAQAIEQYWRLGALRRSRSGDFLSRSRRWQMSSRDETVRLGLARFFYLGGVHVSSTWRILRAVWRSFRPLMVGRLGMAAGNSWLLVVRPRLAEFEYRSQCVKARFCCTCRCCCGKNLILPYLDISLPGQTAYQISRHKV